MRLARVIAVVAMSFCLSLSVARAEETRSANDNPRGIDLEVSGYLQPEAEFSYRPSAVRPRDRRDYGAGATSAGIEVGAKVLSDWRFDLHLVFSGEFLSTVTEVEAIDSDGDGSTDDVAQTSRVSPAFAVERAAVTWQLQPRVHASFGQMRIPFTLQQQISNTALLFPRRSDVNEAFLSGSDLGALLGAEIGEGKFQASAGVFNGTNVPIDEDRQRGLLYAARVDYQPTGVFAHSETDPQRGPLRVGLGGGLLYSDTTLFDEGGFLSMSVRDLRLSASARIALRGFHAQAELLRHQRTDSLSSSPRVSTGAYLQSSYTLPVRSMAALAPIARIGWASERQGALPRRRLWSEAGVAIFPNRHRAEALKVVAQYIGEFDLESSEKAHGGRLQIQLAW